MRQMPTTPLLTTTVRPDWEEITNARALRQARYWTALQLALVFATLLVLLLRLVFPGWQWHPLLWAALFIPIAWALPLIAIFRGAGLDRSSTRQTLVAALGLVCAALALACVGAPAVLGRSSATSGNLLPPLFGLLVPALTWPVLVQTYRRFPVPSRKMGLTPDRWLPNIVMGAAAAAAMGLSLVLVAGTTLRPGLLQPPDVAALAWLLAYEIGLRAPGEELLFRGLVYDTLVGDPTARVIPGIARVVLLNLLVYAVPLVSATTIEGRLGIVVYGAALACTTTLLRHRQRSLLPGMAASAVFSLFAASFIR
jgi:hypothetical protein